MCKILVFVAFLLYLVNSEYTKDCPSGYFDGKDGYCYHIGNEEMSQSEAEKYCKIKHGKLSRNLAQYNSLPPKPLEKQLSQYVKLYGDRIWWISDCHKIEFVNFVEPWFDIQHDCNCNASFCNSKGRKPICEITRF